MEPTQDKVDAMIELCRAVIEYQLYDVEKARKETLRQCIRRSLSILRPRNKREYAKQYYIEHRRMISEKHKEYRNKNKEIINISSI